jgi:hypothetical protein
MALGKGLGTVSGLVVAALVAVSCGKSVRSPGSVDTSGQGGEAGEGGASVAGKGGVVSGSGAGGQAGDGTGGVGDAGGGSGGAAGAAPGGAGAGGVGGAGGGCVHDGKEREVGEVFASGQEWEVCECKAGGELNCFDGCSWVSAESYRLIAQARGCAPGEPAQCQVLKTVELPFAGDYVSFFNEASLGALDGLQRFEDLHAELDCDAPIALPKPRVAPTVAYCKASGICEDYWTGLNLLQNGGFEAKTGDAPTAWVLTPLPAFALLAQARTGDGALALTLSDTTVTNRAAAKVVLPAPVSGHTVTLSGYYRVDRVDSELALTLTLDGSGMSDPSYPIPAPTSAGVWQAFKVEDLSSRFTVELSAVLGARLVSGAPTTLAFDDLVLEETTGR